MREQKRGTKGRVGDSKGKGTSEEREERSLHLLSQVQSVPAPHTRPSSVLIFPRQNNARCG